MAVICCHVLSKQGLLFRQMRRLWTGCECALSVRFSLLGRSVQSASLSFTVFNQKMCEVSIAPSPFQIRPPVILSLWTFQVQHAERSQQFGDTGCSMPWELVEWKLWNVRNVGSDSCALILLARCKSEEAEQTLAAGILADFDCRSGDLMLSSQWIYFARRRVVDSCVAESFLQLWISCTTPPHRKTWLSILRLTSFDYIWLKSWTQSQSSHTSGIDFVREVEEHLPSQSKEHFSSQYMLHSFCLWLGVWITAEPLNCRDTKLVSQNVLDPCLPFPFQHGSGRNRSLQQSANSLPWVGNASAVRTEMSI